MSKFPNIALSSQQCRYLHYAWPPGRCLSHTRRCDPQPLVSDCSEARCWPWRVCLSHEKTRGRVLAARPASHDQPLCCMRVHMVYSCLSWRAGKYLLISSSTVSSKQDQQALFQARSASPNHINKHLINHSLQPCSAPNLLQPNRPIDQQSPCLLTAPSSSPPRRLSSLQGLRTTLSRARTGTDPTLALPLVEAGRRAPPWPPALRWHTAVPHHTAAQLGRRAVRQPGRRAVPPPGAAAPLAL